MINEKVISFYKKFVETASECERFCYLSRAKELQIESRDRLNELHKEAHTVKLEVISQGDEDAANAMLSFEKMISADRSELDMWIMLKEDDPGEAWNFLVTAQIDAQTAFRIHSVGGHLANYIQHLDILEQVLFPPQKFASIGVIVKDAECSVCGEEYGECNHIKGRAYMGEECTRLINHVELQEISIVDNPANKRCRVSSVCVRGATRDILTWRIIPSEPESIINTQE